MDKLNFNYFLEIEPNKVSLLLFSNIENKVIESKIIDLSNISRSPNPILSSEKIIEENIYIFEKSIKNFFKSCTCILKNLNSSKINLSISKNLGGKIIEKNEIEYLIRDGKQQIETTNNKIKICHILISSFNVDGKIMTEIPLGIECNKLSVELKFICFSEELILSIENLFINLGIKISKFICHKYLSEYSEKDPKMNIYSAAYDILNGANVNEVDVKPKKMLPKGFFVRLFNFFR
tara:strand:- start:57 stop:764 length:708 start_codon:yes stop_codon:yes gene_type:complete